MEKEKEKLIAGLKAEHDALEKRLTSLIKALDSKGLEEKVGEAQMELLLDQESAMRLYLRTLAMRIEDLEDCPKEESKTEKAENKPSEKEGIEKEVIDAVEDAIKKVNAMIEKCSEDSEQTSERSTENGSKPKDDNGKAAKEGEERDDAPDLAKDILSLLERCLDKDEEKKDCPREDWFSPWFWGTAYTITC